MRGYFGKTHISFPDTLFNSNNEIFGRDIFINSIRFGLRRLDSRTKNIFISIFKFTFVKRLNHKTLFFSILSGSKLHSPCNEFNDPISYHSRGIRKHSLQTRPAVILESALTSRFKPRVVQYPKVLYPENLLMSDIVYPRF